VTVVSSWRGLDRVRDENVEGDPYLFRVEERLFAIRHCAEGHAPCRCHFFMSRRAILHQPRKGDRRETGRRTFRSPEEASERRVEPNAPVTTKVAEATGM
jgi:hypothetical protein